jgi:ABC-2 type transport system permease protein
VSIVLSIMRREIQAYFVSPIAYTVMVIFLLIAGVGFFNTFEWYGRLPEFVLQMNDMNIRNSVIRDTTLWINVGMIFALPALSMRLFSEERKIGTAELLMTSPLTTPQLVLGKFFGTLAIVAMVLVLTSPFVGVLMWKAAPELPAILTAYVGYFMYGAVIVSIGLFASAITENQIIALLLTYVIFLPLYLIELVAGFAPPPWDSVLNSVTIGEAMRKMTLGDVQTHFFVLNACVVFVFLFLCAQVIDSNRWR